VKYINAGAVTLYVQDAIVLNYLEQLTDGAMLETRLVLRDRVDPTSYRMWFSGGAAFAGYPPLASADSQIDGVRVALDLDRPAPIVWFDLLQEGFDPAAEASGADDYVVLLYEP
jgi:hypothetical protein